MKQCRICKENKELSGYNKQERNKDGLFHECKKCTEERRRIRRKTNSQKTKKLDRQHYLRHKQYYITKGRLRAKGIRQAKPKWLTTDHKWVIDEIYELRDLRSSITGVEHHVDHIVPLKGKHCCGFHVPWNLRVITAEENLSKSNTY